jgi:acetyltransferase
MKKFFEPNSVALIGVPRKTGVGALNNAEMMIRYGYKGRIYPINPNAKEICGLKSYPSISYVSEPVDLAVISVGRDRVLPMLKECVQSKVQRIIIITQGFGDADERGKAMQEEIVHLAKQTGIRIVGPNTMGVVNNFKHFTTAFIDLVPPSTFSPVSLIAQTGVIQVASNDMAYKHWGKAIDVGNGCDVDTVEALDYFADDPDTRIIAIHMEGTNRGRMFLEAAKRATVKKPVIIFKSGRSKAGAKAALSHTGSLVGDDHIFDAMCRRTGLIRVKGGPEFKDAIHALLCMRAMEGPRIGVLTITGAGGIMVADACEDFGLNLAKLPEGLAEKLKEGIPDWINVSNPIDIWPIGMIGGNYPGVFETALTELISSREVDGVLVIIPVSDSPLHKNLNVLDVTHRVREKAGPGKPIAMWPYMDTASFIDKYEAIDAVACFPSIEQAVQGLSFCHRYHMASKSKESTQRSFTIQDDYLEPLLARGREEGLLIGEEALSVLRAFGIPAVKGITAKTREELERLTSKLKPPFVLKLTGSNYLHKSEWGGVITGIKDLSELLKGWDELKERVHRRNRNMTVDTVHVQEQASGHELLFGLKGDPQFGHVIVCGLGGIYTEIFQDISRNLVPIDGNDARTMLRSLKILPLLEGVRGTPGVHWDTLIEIMERLSFLALEIPDIVELDINPFIATKDGGFAADARIIW